MSNKNRWKEIWSKKTLISDGHQNIEDLFIQMKIADGYDALGNLKITYLDFKAQFDDILYHLENCCNGRSINAQSAFEVGCGCGPNLLLLQDKGLIVGGIDYSETLIQSARKFIKTDDLTVGEAVDLGVLPPPPPNMP